MSQTIVHASEEDLTAGTTDGLPPKYFSLDPEARTVRAVAGLLAVFLGLALFGLAALWLGEEHAGLAGWSLVTSAGVYVVLAFVACLLPRPSDGDGLSLDSNGLTLIRAGHHCHWPWSDLGDFTIATRSRLAGWFLGGRILIRIPAMPRPTPTVDSARQEATTLCIAGDHLATDDQIANALAAFRDHEVGPLTSDDSHVRSPSGIYHLRDQGTRTVKTRTVPISGLVSWVSVYATASVIGGLYDGWQAFVGHWTDPLSHPIILTVATLFVPYDIWSGLRKLAPAGNHLQVDADGLLLEVDGRRRRWRWDSVSAPEIQEASGADGATRRCIVFIARHDGFSSGPQTTPGLLPAALRFIVEDIYDAPLETMVGRMAEFRAGFRSDPVATAANVPGAVPLPT